MAIEEQGAATQEISGNIQRTATGTSEVAGTIAEVSKGANQTGAASSQLLSSAKQLSGSTTSGQAEIDGFSLRLRRRLESVIRASGINDAQAREYGNYRQEDGGEGGARGEALIGNLVQYMRTKIQRCLQTVFCAISHDFSSIDQARRYGTRKNNGKQERQQSKHEMRSGEQAAYPRCVQTSAANSID